jgi:hypothetical protein
LFEWVLLLFHCQQLLLRPTEQANPAKTKTHPPQEVERTASESDLFRTNSLGTKMLRQLLRSQDYLTNLLSPIIRCGLFGFSSSRSQKNSTVAPDRKNTKKPTIFIYQHGGDGSS